MMEKNNSRNSHNSIEAQPVFSNNNQVFLKRIGVTSHDDITETTEWYPINFQWIPVINLNKELK